MLPRPTSASHVSRTGEICTIAEKRPPRCGTRREPISANPLACREEDRGAALAETGRRTGVPAGIAHNPGARMFRSCREACGREEGVHFGTHRSAPRAAVAPVRRGPLVSGGGEILPIFSGMGLALCDGDPAPGILP